MFHYVSLLKGSILLLRHLVRLDEITSVRTCIEETRNPGASQSRTRATHARARIHPHTRTHACVCLYATGV